MNPNNHNGYQYPYESNNAHTVSFLEQQYSKKPYDLQQFLDQTFNYNDGYISAFKTLPHETKLKFYLSVQEMKMLGKMDDQEGYQKILKEIARRVMLIKTSFTQANNRTNSPQKGWGVKMDTLCDEHLKKMQHNDLLDDFPVDTFNKTATNSLDTIDFMSGYQAQMPNNRINNNYHTNNTFSSQKITNDIDMHPPHDTVDQNNTEQEQEQQFEWVQSNNAQLEVDNNSNAYQNSGILVSGVSEAHDSRIVHLNISQSKQLELPQEKNDQKEEEDEWEWNQQEQNEIPTNIQAQNTTGMTKTHNIEPQDNKNHEPHIDIWDMQMNEDIIQEEKQKISQAFNPIHTQQNHDKNQHNEDTGVEKPSFSRKAVSQYQYHPGSHKISESNNLSHSNKEEVKSNQQWVNDHEEIQFHDAIVGGFSNNRPPSRTASGPSEYYSEDPYDNYNDFTNDILDTYNDGIDYKNQAEPELVGAFTKNLSPSVQNSELDNPMWQPEGYVNINNSEKLGEEEQSEFGQSQKKQISINEKLQGGYALYLMGNEVKPIIINEEVIKTQSNYEQTNFGPEQLASLEFFTATGNDKDYQESLNEYQSSNQINPPLFQMNHNQSFLEQFKSYFETTKLRQYLNKQAYFDVQRQFYHLALKLMESMGYHGNNSDYQYLKDQMNICEEIYNYTELYTSAVDQNQEHVVMDAIAKSKQLYKSLNISKTSNVVQKYLGLNGMSKKYYIAKLSLDAGIPKQLIAKYAKHEQFEQILASQYAIENLSSITNISTFSTHIVDYLQKQLAEMQRVASRLAEYPSKIQKHIKGSQKFLQYRRDLIEIVILGKKFLDLGKICLKDSNDSHILALDEHIRQILSLEQSSSKLLNKKYVQFYSDFACDPHTTIYSLFSEFRKLILQQPICSICLGEVHDQNDGTLKSKDDQKYYHYKCFNLEKAISTFKLRTLEAPFILPEKQSYQNEKSEGNNLQSLQQEIIAQ